MLRDRSTRTSFLTELLDLPNERFHTLFKLVIVTQNTRVSDQERNAGEGACLSGGQRERRGSLGGDVEW